MKKELLISGKRQGASEDQNKYSLSGWEIGLGKNPWGQLTPLCTVLAAVAIRLPLGAESTATARIILQCNYDVETSFPVNERQRKGGSKQLEISLIPLSEALSFSQNPSHPKWDLMM